MSQVLYFDCFSGAAGDMVLGALIDAGVPVEELRRALGTLGVGHELRVSRVLRAGLSATRVEVLDAGQVEHAHTHEHHTHGHHAHVHHEHDHDHGHDAHPHHSHAHSHPHAHGHRSLAEIAHLIDHSALSAAGKTKAVALFRRLAEAEAAIHQMPVEDVHLHEVGAVDSIIDIVGAVFALEWLGIDDIVSSPLNVGGGTVEIAHGRFPVPAPATVRLLAGVPIYNSGSQVELVTPTGALLVSGYARAYGALPPMAVRAIGYGAGRRDFETSPNVLRVLIGERVQPAAAVNAGQTVVKIECEIDDMNPQLFGPVSDRLLGSGALDVFLTPVQMKKGRPGTLVTVLAPPAARDALCDILFRETTTIGVRFEEVARETLDRTWVDVEVVGGRVRIKVASRRGQTLNATPEFDDCLRVADATGRPVKDVQAEAMHAWLALSKDRK
ncbi:MAG TPA: nickel pincer cofactor biosynthesis protein LarC [Vicinamibacterales bacterium]|nr:nickel pincer cofactor biosynthesis protein LarC [Vicinamibacterales bacterium]